MNISDKEKEGAKAGKQPESRVVDRRRRASFRGGGAPLARPAAVAEFQSDAIEVAERVPPRMARLTLYCVVALIVSAVVWASLSQVETIVVGQGKLITTNPNLVVQPLETSVIREIRVKAGDHVNRGEVLATLDPTFSQADLDQLRTRVAALDATINRLKAELGNYEFALIDPSNPDEALQAKIFLQRKVFYETQLRNFDAQIASARANLKTSQDEASVLSQRLETMKSIETMRGALMDKQVGSKLNLLLSRDARLEVESNFSRVLGNQVDYEHKVEKARADQEVFVEEFRRTAYQELVETIAKRNSASEDQKKAELRRHLIVLSAPADSIVLEIANRTVGSVVREAETLFVLVPRDVPLQAEVNVEGRDIGQISVGQAVRIKFDAFPFQKFGTGVGTVRVVSHDTFAADPKADGGRKAAPFYRVLVDVNETRLRLQPAQMLLIPGMAVTAEMKVGKRSVMSYFLYPLLRGLDESIREP